MRGQKRSLLLALLLCLIGVITMAGIYRREKNEDDSAKAELAEFSEEDPSAEDSVTENAAKEDSAAMSAVVSDEEDFTETEAPVETENAAVDSSAEDVSENGDAEAADDDIADRQAEETLSGTVASDLNFQADSVLTWPVQGELLMEFSMEQPVYFATLAQYKLCPGILIQAEEGSIVYAGADACVTAVGQSDELGETVTLDLGNGYTALYGQLKAVNVSEGDMVSAGAALGLVAEPTKYYCVEGDHVYLQLEKDGTPIDPLDYLD